MSVADVILRLSTQLLYRSALRLVGGFPHPPTTMASADFCPSLDRSPRIRCDNFPLTLAAFTWDCFDPFWTSLSLASLSGIPCLFTQFLFIKSRFCFRLPSHARSHSRSCLPLTVRRTNVRRGLSPPRYRPCRAYKRQRPGEAERCAFAAMVK